MDPKPVVTPQPSEGSELHRKDLFQDGPHTTTEKMQVTCHWGRVLKPARSLGGPHLMMATSLTSLLAQRSCVLFASLPENLRVTGLRSKLLLLLAQQANGCHCCTMETEPELKGDHV